MTLIVTEGRHTHILNNSISSSKNHTTTITADESVFSSQSNVNANIHIQILYCFMSYHIDVVF